MRVRHISPFTDLTSLMILLDALDKGVDLVQEHGFGQGQQKNESAVEQAKDEKISDGIRSAYKKVAGKDVPIADK